MLSWEYVRLSENCEVFPGFAFDSDGFTDNPEDIHLVKGENLHQNYIDWEKAKRWNQHDWQHLNKYQLRASDIVLAMDRPWVEAGLKWAYISKRSPKALLVQRVARLRSRNNLDQNFLRHVVGSKLFEGYLKMIVTGVNVPHISGKQIGDFKFYLPPLPIQRKIAAILSAYDDLIENNNRRIAILEKMAEELYREWFVRLRFPRHESTKIVKGVPEGWEVRTALQLMHVMGGGTPATEVPNFWDGEIPFFTPKDSHHGYYANLTEKSITPLGLENCNSPLYPKDTIFITARGTVGNIVLALKPMAMNQSCYALKPASGLHIYFYFLALRNTVSVIKGTANSGVFDNIITDSFKQFTLFKPTDNLLAQFEDIVAPMMKQVEILIQSNVVLNTTRDRLLSRLMSGKIDVETLDIAFPASMREDAGASTGSATATDFTAKKTSSVTEPVGEPVEPVEAPAK